MSDEWKVQAERDAVESACAFFALAERCRQLCLLCGMPMPPALRRFFRQG